jgi:hypothetical protein
MARQVEGIREKYSVTWRVTKYSQTAVCALSNAVSPTLRHTSLRTHWSVRLKQKVLSIHPRERERERERRSSMRLDRHVPSANKKAEFFLGNLTTFQLSVFH